MHNNLILGYVDQMNSNRSFQKKVASFVKDFASRSSVIALIEDFDQVSDVDIFVRPLAFLETFAGDVNLLREIGEKALKFLARCKGKRTLAMEELSAWHEGLNDLHESFSSRSPGKRGHNALEEEAVNQSKKQKASDGEQMSIFVKDDLKEIYNSLSTRSDIGDFLYPVDQRRYPEYNEVIEKPMDLTTWNKYIGKFSGLGEALKSLRLIWQNCLQFNLSSSDIAKQAVKLGSISEKLIEEKFGKKYVTYSWKSKFGEYEDVQEFTTSVKNVSSAMKQLTKALMKCDSEGFFSQPVTEEVAPGYFDVINHPMDLSVIQRGLNKGVYDTSQGEALLATHLNLVWNNCLQYNEPTSDIANMAVKLFEMAKKIGHEVDFSAVSSLKITREAKNSDNPRRGRPGGFGSHRRNTDPPESLEAVREMKQILKKLRSYELIAPFLIPVDVRVAPGYLDIIKQPMDISTVETKLTRGVYDDNHPLFVRDVILIWKNCINYNHPKSEIYHSAVKCQEYFKGLLLKCKLLEEDKPIPSAMNIKGYQDKITKNSSNNSDQGSGLLNENTHKAVPQKREETTARVEDNLVEAELNDSNNEEEENDEAGEDADILDDHAALENKTESRKERKRRHQTFRARKYRHVLKQIFDHELSYVLKIGEKNHSSTSIKADIFIPTTLLGMKDNVEGYQDSQIRFRDDILRIFDKLIKDTIGDTRKAVEDLKEFAINVFYKNFPSLLSVKRQMEITSETTHPIPTSSAMVIGSEVVKAADQPPFKPNISYTAHAEDENRQGSDIILPFDHRSIAKDINSSKLDELLSSLACLKSDVSITYQQVEDTLSSSEGILLNLKSKGEMLLNKTLIPFVVSPGLYEIQSFGTFVKDVSSSEVNFLCPVGYVSVADMAIGLVKEEVKGESRDFVDMKLFSCVAKSPANKIRFLVTLEKGTIVSEADNPRDAWLRIRGRESKVLRCLGSVLDRCNSVLNRLSCSPDALFFLDAVDFNTELGATYYKVIKAPMWLREVHSRLVRGDYDSEFDFAWDIRLIFRNCQIFNLEESEVYMASQRLQSQFEILFSRWVLNIVDKDVEILAEGPWTEWADLQLFDLNDNKFEGKSGRGFSATLQCSWCKDRCEVSIEDFPKRSERHMWICGRCENASMWADANIQGDPFLKLDLTSTPGVNNVSLDANTYLPAPDVGMGWFYVKKRGKHVVKSRLLSPYGYEVEGKEQVALQKSLEAGWDGFLSKEREIEFQQQIKDVLKTTKIQKKKTIRRMKGTGVSSAEPQGDFKLSIGKFSKLFFSVNTGVTSWHYSDKNLTHSPRPIDFTSLPESGFFGLELEEVKDRVVGLDNFTTCTSFIEKELPKLTEDCRKDMDSKKKLAEMVSKARKFFSDLLLRSCWEWRKCIVFPSRPNRSNNHPTLPSQKSNFKPFLLGNLQHSVLECILCLWDFLDLAGLSISTSFTLLDLVKSVNPPVSLLPTCSQLIFEEVNCLLTELLLRDLRRFGDDEKSWQSILMAHPLNPITWPAVAEKLIFIKSIPFSADEKRHLLLNALDYNQKLTAKLLCLVYSNPVFLPLLSTSDNFNHTLKYIRSQLFVLNPGISIKILWSNFEEAVLQCFRSAPGKYPLLLQHEVSQWIHRVAPQFDSPKVGMETLCDVDQELTWDNLKSLVSLDFTWGGFTLRSSASSPGLFILKMSDFNAGEDTLHWKLKMAEYYDSCLHVLTSSETETWKAHERLAVYMTLLDLCMVADCIQDNVLNDVNLESYFHFRLPSASAKDVAELVQCMESAATLSPKSVCPFTRLPATEFSDPFLWTKVSPDHAKIIDTQNTTSEEIGDDSCEQNLALKEAYASFLIMQGQSEKDKRQYEDVISKLETNLHRGSFCKTFSSTSATVQIRSLPLGYDRDGGSYWLIPVQEFMTIFPLDSTGKSFDPADPLTSEPCLLHRDIQGRWSYHNGQISAVGSLIDSLSFEIACERHLRSLIVEKYFLTKTRLLLQTQTIRGAQRVWLDKKLLLDRWIAEMSLHGGTNDNYRCRQLDVVWARSVESRMYLHYASIFRVEEGIDAPDPYLRERLHNRHKHMRDLRAEDCLDHHPLKGWSRVNVYTRISQLAAVSSAGRILFEGQIAPQIQASLSASSFLEKQPFQILQQDDNEELTYALTPAPQPAVSSDFKVAQCHIITSEKLHACSVNEVQAIIGEKADAALKAKDLHEIQGFQWIPFQNDCSKIEGTSRVISLTFLGAKTVGQVLKESESSLRKTKEKSVVNSGAPVTSQADAFRPSAPNEAARFVYSLPSVPRVQTHIITSTVTVSAKILRLKAEMLNLLFVFPEKALRWPDQDSITESAVLSAGEAAAAQVYASAAKYATSCQQPSASIDLSAENIERMADRAARKAKRRLRRKLATENFFNALQKALTMEDLLKLILVLDQIIPVQLRFKLPLPALPNPTNVSASNVAAYLAIWVYTLDRSVAYHELGGVENAYQACPYKLRCQFVPRCYASAACGRSMGHHGKCSQAAPTFSRTPDHFQLAPPSENFVPQTYSSAYQHQNQREAARSDTATGQLYSSHRSVSRVREEISLHPLCKFSERSDLDVEFVNPYVPTATELTRTQWV